MKRILAIFIFTAIAAQACDKGSKRIYVRDSLPDEELYHVILDNNLRLTLLDEKEIRTVNKTSKVTYFRTRPDLKTITVMLTFTDKNDFVYSDPQTVDVKGGEGKGVIVCSQTIGLDPDRKSAGRNIYVDMKVNAIQIETAEEVAELTGNNKPDEEKIHALCDTSW